MRNLRKRVLRIATCATALWVVGNIQAVHAEEVLEETIQEEVFEEFALEVEFAEAEEVEEVNAWNAPYDYGEIVIEVGEDPEEVPAEEFVEEFFEELEEVEEVERNEELVRLQEDLELLAKQAQLNDLEDFAESLHTLIEQIDSLIDLGDKWKASDFDTEDIEEFSSSIQAIIDLIPGAEDSLYKPVMSQLTEIAQDISRSVSFGLTGWADPFNYYRLDTLAPRIHLLKQSVESINISTTELTHKVQEAHIQIGFEVTRSILNLIDPFIQKEALIAQTIRLTHLMDRVHEFKDLEPGDVATIYTKSQLDRTIWELRTFRDRELLGKVSFQDYAAYNFAITQAVNVQLNPRSTVQDIDRAVEKLKEVYQKAQSLLPTGEDAFASKEDKQELSKFISRARHVRDFELVGKVSFDTYHAINQAITKAVGLQLSSSARKAEIFDAMAAVDDALSVARLEKAAQ